MPADSRPPSHRPTHPGPVAENRPPRRGPVHVLGSLLTLLGPSACFDPDTSPLDGGEASTGAPSTTSGPPSSSSSDGGSATSTTGSSSGAQDSSSGAVTGLDSGTEGTSTGEPVVESSSSGEPSTSSGESSTGEEPSAGYGDCQNNPPAAVCQPDEQCLDFGPVAVCAAQSCMGPGDCAVPSTGNPGLACADLDGNGANDCYLECSMGQACPDGMVCYGGVYCMWEIILVPGVCPDQDLGSAVPQAIMGDNTGLGEDHFTSCGNGGGEDAMYAFTAPVAGTYMLDTVGTAFDTILSVLDSCGGAELACNDDSGGFLTSQIMIALVAGQTVIIVVDGYSATTGPFNLNIGVL
jgi:hypothetical protein